MTRPRDLPVGGRRPRLVWTKRRWRCDQAACRRGSFTEAVPAVPARKRLTSRQVEGRTAQAVIDWLDAREQSWRDAVRFVAIDMCTIFKSAVRRALPQATLVVDHFHLVQLANQTLTEVRRRITVTHRGRRGRKGNREWELRNRPTRSAARMRGEHVDALLDELADLPTAIGVPITAAWNAKEDLLDLLATARTHPDREHIRDLLDRFYRRCAHAGLPELHRLATTVETWQAVHDLLA